MSLRTCRRPTRASSSPTITAGAGTRSGRTKDTTEQKELRASGLYHLGGHRLEFSPGDPQGMVRIYRHSKEVASTVSIGSDGEIEFYVPQIYPKPTIPTYLVCGTMIEGRSFTRNEQDALIDYQADQGLEEKSNRLSKMQIDWAKSSKTDRDAEMLAGLQKSLETARDKLYEKVANDPNKLKTVKPQLQAIADQLRDLDLERGNLEQDPSEVVAQVNSVSDEQRELNR